MRLAFVLSEIGSGLRRNLSMVISVILVTFVSLTFVGAAGMLQLQINQNGTTVVMATHDDDIVNEMRKRVVELKNGVVIRDEAKALYTSMIPVVGQSRRLRDASGRDEPPAVAPPRAGSRAEARAEIRTAGEAQA